MLDELTPDEVTRLAQLDAAAGPFIDALGAAALNPPPVAGADILSDIWSAVSWSLQAPGNFFSWSVGQFTSVLNWVTSQAGNIKDFVVARVEWAANNLVIPAVNGVLGFVQSLPGSISAAASWVRDQVQSALTAGWNFVSEIVTWVRQQLGSAIDALTQFVEGSFTWLWNAVKPLYNWVEAQVTAGVNWLAGVIRPIFDWVGTQVAAGINWLWQAVAPIFAFTAAQVAGGVNWLAGQTFNYVIQGAAALGDGFQTALDWLINSAFGGVAATTGRIINVPYKMLSGAYRGLPEILADLNLGADNGGFARFMYSLCAFIPTLASLAVGLGPIYAADALQGANRIVGPQLYSMTDARDAWLRNLITDAQHDDELARMGFNAAHVSTIRQLYFEPAPPSDLVRFLVREVFDPAQRQQLQLDGDYPAAADAEARKVGLSPEVMRNYWAAHWQLPSPTQVYEMLHRGFVDAAAVDRYLKSADYSPAWRANLAAISYNVPGRIDLRRMYAAGVIDEPRLLKGYKDLGYNAQDAQILTDFAKRAAAGNPPELPRGVILEAYRDGELNRAAALAELQALGFDAIDANLMLDLEDLANARQNQRLIEDAIEADFKAGLITEAIALARLAENGIPAQRANLLVYTWRNRNMKKPLTLTAAQVQHAAREQLIPDQLAFARLQAIGYNDTDANILVRLAHPAAPQDEPAHLTLGHLFNARREGLLNDAQLVGRLQRMGYPDNDVAILVQLAAPDAVQPEVAELTKADLIAAAKKKVLPIDAVQRRLVAKGYIAQDVDILLRNQGFDFTPTGLLVSYPRRELTIAQLGKAFRDGLIEEKEYRFRLGELAYDEDDVQLLVEMNLPKDEAAA